jgi:hypothetical protein
MLLSVFITVGCASGDDAVEPTTWEIGAPTVTDYPEDYYAGGLLGTTSVNTATRFRTTYKSGRECGYDDGLQ